MARLGIEPRSLAQQLETLCTRCRYEWHGYVSTTSVLIGSGQYRYFWRSRGNRGLICNRSTNHQATPRPWKLQQDLRSTGYTVGPSGDLMHQFHTVCPSKTQCSPGFHPLSSLQLNHPPPVPGHH